MDVVGGTFVGGSSSGWSILDPNANMHALGMTTAPMAQPVYGGGFGFGAPATAAPFSPAFGNGMVGGSWSPEPAGNNQILYGHYSSAGALAVPQTLFGQQAVSMPTTTAAPLTSAAPLATTQPASTTAGGATETKPKPADKPAADKPAAEKPAADDKKPAAKKTVAVKSGDTLSEIAAKHGTTWQKLYEANKGVIGGNPNLIRPGQTLKIPA